jgi:methionyl-tRNA formyltransferase
MTDKLNLIFMGTPDFSVPTLRALIDAGHKIIAVYTQPPRPAGRGQKETPSPVHQFALSHNIPVYTPLTLKDPETQSVFREHKADAAIVAAYGLLLPKQILEIPALGCINVHPSLLPRWRGAAPIERTIMAGDKETGVVIMQMDAGLDTGDMLLKKRFSIPDGMKAGELRDMLANMAAPMVIETLKGLKEGKILPEKQHEHGITYAHKITKEECRIDWSKPAEAIRNKILGLSPAPGAFFIYKGEAIKILDAKIALHAKTGNYKPGTIIDNNFTVACGSDAIQGLYLQRPGKKSMLAYEMLRGYPILEGELLE